MFNATYRQQAEVDARLTNGADVTVTESPGAAVGRPGRRRRWPRVPGVRHVEPLQHRFAYVGADLQDLYGVRPATIVDATSLQDAYFPGGTAAQLIGRLGRAARRRAGQRRDGPRLPAPPGDPLTLRLQDGRTKAYRDGAASTTSASPRSSRPRRSDSFLVANADYVAAATGSDAVGDLPRRHRRRRHRRGRRPDPGPARAPAPRSPTSPPPRASSAPA